MDVPATSAAPDTLPGLSGEEACAPSAPDEACELSERGCVLALDIGQRRIGVAASDFEQCVAFPVCVLDAAEVEGGARSWRRVLEDHDPVALLCGLPRSLDGQEHDQAARIRTVAGQIARRAGLPLVFVDERLSSAEAKRSLRAQGMSERDMRGKVDMVAASLFLQAWLDARR